MENPLHKSSHVASYLSPILHYNLEYKIDHEVKRGAGYCLDKLETIDEIAKIDDLIALINIFTRKFGSFGSLITQHTLKIKLQYNGRNYMVMNIHDYKGFLQRCI